MAEDLLDAIRDQLANFAVGLVERVEGAGSKVLGSGVLVSIEGRRGILTCGHVAEQYDKLREIGLARFTAVTQQRRIMDIAHAHHIIVRSSDKWTEGDLDLAFTYLPPKLPIPSPLKAFSSTSNGTGEGSKVGSQPMAIVSM